MEHIDEARAHKDACPDGAGCLVLESTAVIASALAPIHVGVLIKQCNIVSIPCRANPTKLYIAGLVRDKAQRVIDLITAESCAMARQQFKVHMGYFTRFLLRTQEDRESVSVPWSSLPVGSTDLLATLDVLSRDELRAILNSLEIKVARNTRKAGMTYLLFERFESVLVSYSDLDDDGLRDWLASYLGHAPPADFRRKELLMAALDFLLPQEALVVFMSCPHPDGTPTAKTLVRYREAQTAYLLQLRRRIYDGAVADKWPQPVPELIKTACMQNYHAASAFRPARGCAICARSRVDLLVKTFTFQSGSNADGLSLEALECDDPWLKDHPAEPFKFIDHSLDGLMLYRYGMVHTSRHESEINICAECEPDIRSARVPKLSLRNGLFRGYLPPELQDINWIEERVCAIYRCASNITRIFKSNNPDLSFVLYGNTCAHPQNVVDTAKILPRTAGDVADHIGVMFVGPGKYKPKGLATFRVRRQKLIDLMKWLIANNKLYANVVWDESRFAEYPEDGPLPGIDSRVVHDEVEDTEQQFSKETSGMDTHPALAARRLDMNEEFVFMDALGITSSSADTIGARTFEAAALTNILPMCMRTPDVTLHRGSTAVGEYGNCKLFPGLYPTLFPFGIGGLEDWEVQHEKKHVGFRAHANYLIDLRDRRFSAHPEFMFVVVNILQRRAVHLETRFRLKTSRIDAITPDLLSITAEQIKRVAAQLQANGSYSSISPEDKPVLELLRLVEMVAAKVPGSHAMKQSLRRKIFALCRHFGVPQVYLTLNPNPVHSPMFHLMAGDESVDLLSRYPKVAASVERSMRVARDPATAAHFFSLSIRLVFEHMLGWDFDKQRSTPRGGILGHLEAFAMSDELTNRGVLHGHAVWQSRWARRARGGWSRWNGTK